MAEMVSGNVYEIPQKGSYKAVKFVFEEDTVHTTFASDEKDFEFTAGFSKPIFGKTVGTHFASLEQEDNSPTVATAVWNTKKDLEITLRLVGTPSVVKVIADFSKEPDVQIKTIRCKI